MGAFVWSRRESGKKFIGSFLCIFLCWQSTGWRRSLYGSKTALLCAAHISVQPAGDSFGAICADVRATCHCFRILSTWLYLQFAIRRNDSRRLLCTYILVNIARDIYPHSIFLYSLRSYSLSLLFHRRTRVMAFAAAVVLSLLPYTFLGSCLNQAILKIRRRDRLG